MIVTMDTLEAKLAPLQEQYSEQLTKRREEAAETFRRFMEVHGDDEKLKQHKTWQAPYVDAFAREVAPKLSVDEVELVLGQSLLEYHGSDWLVVGENDGEPVFGIFDPTRRSAALPRAYAREVVEGNSLKFFGLHWVQVWDFEPDAPEYSPGKSIAVMEQIILSAAFYRALEHQEESSQEVLTHVLEELDASDLRDRVAELNRQPLEERLEELLATHSYCLQT